MVNVVVERLVVGGRTWRVPQLRRRLRSEVLFLRRQRCHRLKGFGRGLKRDIDAYPWFSRLATLTFSVDLLSLSFVLLTTSLMALSALELLLLLLSPGTSSSSSSSSSSEARIASSSSMLRP